MGMFKGRIALVTGGGRGVGAGISTALAAEGAHVAVNYAKDSNAANETVEAILASGGSAKAYCADITDPDACAAMLAAIGGDVGQPDIVVNNAGVASRGNSVVDTAADEAERLLRNHAIGPHHLCRLALPGMRERVKTVGRGDVVFISSIATDGYAANGAPYSMGKAAMEALAYTLAKEELANGIHVNIAAPGLVVTDMGRRLAKAVAGAADIHDLDARFPFGRVATPEDVARVVVFFCSEMAGYLTGQRVKVDGGAQPFRA